MHSFTRRQALALPALAAFSRRAQAIPLERIRLGVTTDEIDEDLLQAIEFLKGFGLHWAELRSVWGKYNTAQPVEKIREARALLDQHKIRTAALGTAFFKVPLPPDSAAGRPALDEQWKLLDAAMERAAILGTDTLRIFAFTYKGAAADQSHYPRIEELLQEAARRAKPRRMRLAVENVAASYVSTAPEAARVLKAVQDPALGLTWDPNNAAASGEKSPFPDGFRLLDPARILHVHLRDYQHTPDGKVVWCAAGDGEFDNTGQIRALLKAGYKGAFTLETHYRHPRGKAHASRLSLTGLLKAIQKA
ncbi:MAG: sugar phosphate isomerase/epimerase [Acidobacteria bacterium]|nr:sugar phosphate isomerase/epimerase [Acidobacteriota bacterium]